MPYKSLEARNRITEEQLAPHIRRRLMGAAVVYGDYGAGEGCYIELAETVQVGDAIAIDENGKGVKAGAQEAVAITSSGGEVGEYAKLEFYKIRSERYNLAKGHIVWLSEGEVNVTTELPGFNEGDMVQRLGVAISEKEMIIIMTHGRVVK